MIDCHTHTATSEAVINLDISQAVSFSLDYLYSAGIHPWNTNNLNRDVFDTLISLADMPQIVAIGECGLDKLRGADMNTQINIFKRHISISEKVCKPIIIHCVKAWQEIIQLRKEYQPKQAWIIHGFRGNAILVNQLINHGFYISFGEKYNDNAIHAVPLNRILIETDDSPKSVNDIYIDIAAELGLNSAQLCTTVRATFNSIISASI